MRSCWLGASSLAISVNLRGIIKGQQALFNEAVYQRRYPGEPRVNAKDIMENIDATIENLKEAKKFIEENPHQAEALIRAELAEMEEGRLKNDGFYSNR